MFVGFITRDATNIARTSIPANMKTLQTVAIMMI